jgi:hypothetical protein
VPLSEVRGLAYSAPLFDEPPLILTWGSSIPLDGAWSFDRVGRERLADLVRGKLLALKAGDRSAPTPPLPPIVGMKHAPSRVTFSRLYGTEPGTGAAGVIGGYGCLLVPTLWLNGLVALLFLAEFSPFEWSRHGLLLLSAVPGLFLACLCAGAAVDQLAWATWTFDDEQVSEGRHLLGIPIERNDRFATRRLGSVAIRPLRHKPHFGEEQTLVSMETGVSFPLGFEYWADLKGRDGKALGMVSGMTAGEALGLMRALRDCLKGTLNESETLLTLPPGTEDSPWDREFDD